MLRHQCTCTVMRTRESEISLVELTSILSQEVKIGNLPATRLHFIHGLQLVLADS